MAMHLRQQLAQARDGVELAPHPGQSIGEEVVSLTQHDVVVLVGFRRRPRGFAALVDTLVTSPATVLLLADATARRHGEAVDHFLEVPLENGSAFDSYAAAASVVSLLSSAVLAASLQVGRARIERIGAAYRRLDELES